MLYNIHTRTVNVKIWHKIHIYVRVYFMRDFWRWLLVLVLGSINICMLIGFWYWFTSCCLLQVLSATATPTVNPNTAWHCKIAAYKSCKTCDNGLLNRLFYILGKRYSFSVLETRRGILNLHVHHNATGKSEISMQFT